MPTANKKDEPTAEWMKKAEKELEISETVHTCTPLSDVMELVGQQRNSTTTRDALQVGRWRPLRRTPTETTATTDKPRKKTQKAIQQGRSAVPFAAQQRIVAEIDFNEQRESVQRWKV